MFVGSIILPEGRDVIATVNALTEVQLRRLPSYLIMGYIVAVLVNRRVLAILPPMAPNINAEARLNINDLERADALLSKTGAFQASVLERGRAILQNTIEQEIWDYDAYPEFSFLDIDFSMFDFSTLGVGVGQIGSI